MMEIEKIRNARTAMEEEIMIASIKAVRDFARATGITPESISIHMDHSRTIGDDGVHEFYFVRDVKATVTL